MQVVRLSSASTAKCAAFWPDIARRGISSLTLAGFMLVQLPLSLLTPGRAWAQDGSGAKVLSRVEYEACQAADETGFHAAIEKLTLKGLTLGLADVDYRALVGDEWRRTNMGDVIDKQVDQSIAEVSDENTLWSKATSLFYKEKSTELANAVSSRVFKSESLKRSLEQLASGVGETLGKQIVLASADTAEPAMQCMQAFLGPRYGKTIARIVASDAGKEFQLDGKATSGVSTTQVLSEHAGGVAGVIILIVRKQLQNMATRVGTRIVGSVLAKLVGTIAGGVGALLIAKDIWDFRNGVLPIIAGEMKSADTKSKIQDELASSMKEQIGENLRDIASKTADRVIDVWQDFRRAHAKVLELSDKSPAFKAFVEILKPEALPRLDEIVALLLSTEGEAGILKRLEDGSLNTAVNVMPAAAFEIAREKRSIEIALAWNALAGERLPLVVENAIHQRAKPEDFTAANLGKLLDLSDKVAIQRLAALEPAVRATLFDAAGPELKSLGRALTEPELIALARYLTGLDKSAASRVLQAVSTVPARMQVLARDGVRDGILASRDQSAAVGMMLTADTGPLFLIGTVADHAQLAYSGRVSPRLMWEKHPGVTVGAGIFVLIIGGMLRRLIFGRRQRVIIQQVPVAVSASTPPIKSGRGRGG